jgi:hypothetical protein
MEASPRAHAMYYRCPARTLAPNSPALAEHPAAVYLREDLLQREINKWVGGLFRPDNLDRTVQTLLASQEQQHGQEAAASATKRYEEAEARLRRFQDAIEAGVDPAALVESINQAQAERTAAKAELDAVPASNVIGEAELRSRINSIGNIPKALTSASREKLAKLYAELGLQVLYKHPAHEADVSIVPVGRVNTARVGGASCALSTRLRLRA